MNKRPAVLTFVAALLVFLAAGCSEKPEPPSQSSGGSEHWLATAPAGIRALDLGVICGSETPRWIGGDGSDPEARACIRTLASRGERGSFASAIATVEGDPIVEISIVRQDGGVTLLRDTTEDRFAARRGWSSTTCLRLRDGEPVACGGEVELRDSAPVEFVDRKPIPSCGSLRVESGGALPLGPELTCLSRAARSGRPAELRIDAIRGEEGPTSTYVRSLGSGRVEVFEDASRGGTGPRTWYLTECDGLDARARPTGCSDQVDLGA